MNVVAITGRLTGDPARRETSKGVVATFRIGSDDAPRVWVDIETWGHLAGTCAAHLAKGRHVAIVGSLAHREWTNQTGDRRERWLVKASTVTFLDRPNQPTQDRGSSLETAAVSQAGEAADHHLTASTRAANGAGAGSGRR